MNKRLGHGIILIGPLIIVALWYILPRLGVIKEFFLPTPIRVGKEVLNLFGTKNVLTDIGYTLYRTVVGFFLAGLWGIPAGLVLGYYAKLYRMFEVVIDFFRSLPATALIPLALIVFAIGETARIFIVLFSCGLVLIINSAYGVKSCNITRLQVAEITGASTRQKFSTVIFREALPEIFAGLRISLSLSLILVVVSEMFIGTTVGLGQKIFDAQLMNHIAEMYGLILITGLLGYGLNKLFVLFERHIIHWGGK
ncbi:ABC transporter permease [candidate division WOR-3 bacterium]|nr:ABC transporter permease [candidate division WOR-3 bacterium]